MVFLNKTMFKPRTGDVVAQLVERRHRDPMDSMTRGSNPVRSTINICERFSESKCCADSRAGQVIPLENEKNEIHVAF